MSEYTTLTSYLEALVAERETLNNVDIEAVVDEKLAKMRAKVKEEVVADIEHSAVIADAKISAITDAIAIVSRSAEVSEDSEENEVSEIISEETY